MDIFPGQNELVWKSPNDKISKLKKNSFCKKTQLKKESFFIYNLSGWAVWYLALSHKFGLFLYVKHQVCYSEVLEWN